MVPEKPFKYIKKIDKDHDGQRIDNYLISCYKGVPKSRLYRAIRKGEVRVNKGRVRQTDRLQAGDEIRLPPLKTVQSKKTLSKIRDFDLKWLENKIIFEDGALLVVDKPAGLAVHGGTGVGHSLLDFLTQLRPNQYFRLVHRLDQATSGCILIAKSREVLLDLQQQFKDRKVEKNYKALVLGRVERPKLTMRTKLEKHRDGESGVRVIASQEGKEAVSHFYIDRLFDKTTLLSVNIETGRMHQIRFQAAEMGHAILGDVKYGDVKSNKRFEKAGIGGLHLHCHQMAFLYKDKRLKFEAPLPDWAKDPFRLDKQ